jgi:hypothetical protein
MARIPSLGLDTLSDLEPDRAAMTTDAWTSPSFPQRRPRPPTGLPEDEGSGLGHLARCPAHKRVGRGIAVDPVRNGAGGPVIFPPDATVAVLVIPADEELEMATQAAAAVA